jgi:site-specific recombinase XerD
LATSTTLSQDEQEVFFNFINSIKSVATKEVYSNNLQLFMKFYNLTKMSDLLKIDVQNSIIKYVISLRESGLSSNTIQVRLNAIFHFYAMNDVILNKKKIKMFKGEFSRKSVDRAYEHEEISKILQVCDLRMKAVILLMASSGMRVGAIPDLRLRNMEKIDNQNIYKVTVYEGSNESYFTFTTPECSSFIDSYLEFRENNGEKLNKDSYLIRDQFDITDIEQIRNKSKGVSLNNLNTIIGTLLVKACLRTVDHTSKHIRKEVARAHGLRKFFTTQLVNSEVNPEIREMLLGHKIGLASAYYKPTEQKILDEYMKAVNALTINEENRLKIKVEKLEAEKDKFDMFAMKVAENFRNIEQRLVNLKAEGKQLTHDDFGWALDEFGITPSFGFDKKTGKVDLGS